MEASPRLAVAAPILLICCVAFFYVNSFVKWRSRTRGRSLPPGPKPLPIIGNLFDMPQHKPWLQLSAMATRYGNIMYMNILGGQFVVISSSRAVLELLEKRSANTSDRLVVPSLSLTGNDVTFSLMPYGRWWRDHRRAMWQVFHPGVVQNYREAQRSILYKLLRKLLKSPEDSQQHVRYAIAATMMKTLYDIDAQEQGDEFIDRIDEALKFTAQLGTGGNPVDILPILRYVPEWMPGAGFQRELAECKAAVDHIKEVPFNALKAAVSRGVAAPCALSALLLRLSEKADSVSDAAYEEDVIKNVGLVVFEGGSDTSYSTLLAVFLAMSLYPEVQRKAQAELDMVVGPRRLPDYEDRDSLVYINALIKEALRWHVVVPLSIPHRTIEDDVYDGYFIPAGTTIIPNSWAILHDPEAYDNPDEFRPDRFIRDGKLDPTVRDPSQFAFGYGRRVCPGRYFAEDMLFLTISSLLHLFKFEPPLDERGQPIKVEFRQGHGLLSHPEDCRCKITPRSAEAISLIPGVEG